MPAVAGSAPEHPPASAFWASGNTGLNRKEIIDVLKSTDIRCNNTRQAQAPGFRRTLHVYSVAVPVCAHMWKSCRVSMCQCC